MLFALGKQNAPVALIMPERIAKTDPFKLITEYVGSGPMVFKKDEWVPGSKAVAKPKQRAGSFAHGRCNRFGDAAVGVGGAAHGIVAVHRGQRLWRGSRLRLASSAHRGRRVTQDGQDPLRGSGKIVAAVGLRLASHVRSLWFRTGLIRH
jgi:peptide/nickel transport system substrate-binding protein